MEDSSGCLLDTNILVRFSDPQTVAFAAIQRAVADLRRSGSPLFYSLQTVAEFWNVATRPSHQNGLGLRPEAADRLVVAIESSLTYLPENSETYSRWRDLVRQHDVRGTQVHDAKLVALMQVQGVRSILTLNPSDFRRYSGINVIVPGLE